MCSYSIDFNSSCLFSVSITAAFGISFIITKQPCITRHSCISLMLNLIETSHFSCRSSEILLECGCLWLFICWTLFTPALYVILNCIVCSCHLCESWLYIAHIPTWGLYSCMLSCDSSARFSHYMLLCWVPQYHQLGRSHFSHFFSRALPPTDQCNPKSLCLVWPCVGAAVMQWLASRPTSLEVLCSDLQDESFEFRPPRQEFFDYSGLAHRPTHQEVLCSDLQGKDSCNILVYMWPSNWSRDISWQVKMASMLLATLSADWCKKYAGSTLYPIRVMM